VTVLQQYAPFPKELADLVSRLRYRPGWRFNLVDVERDPESSHGAAAGGLTLIIYADVYDTYHPKIRRPVNHYFIVPAATYDRRSWQRWLLECVLKVERHEACEWFVVDGERPFAPNHGPGRDPYTIFEYSTEEERRTSFRGEVEHGS
jgi:hypothetical protein